MVKSSSSLAATPVSSPRPNWRQVYSSLFAVAWCAGLSLAYLGILGSYTRNDYFWRNYNSSGLQSFVADTYNTHLWQSVEFPSLKTVLEKDYSLSTTHITFANTMPRRVAVEYVQQSVETAVNAIRNFTARQSIYMYVMYCWLDFGRAWEVAHTAKRQERCYARYKSNGAVYFESLARNVNMTEWMYEWGYLFDVAYGNAVRETIQGQQWLMETSSARGSLTVNQEAQYWLSFNVTEYVLQWQNSYIGAFNDNAQIQTVWGTFSIPINRVAYTGRGSFWTTVSASFGVWNELIFAYYSDMSIVRNATNSIALLDYSMSLEAWIIGADTPWSAVLRSTVGPIAAYDLHYVQPPRGFVQLTALLQRSFIDHLKRNPDLLMLYSKVPRYSLDMVPPAWRKLETVTYYGGNLLCYYGTGQSYVQQSIAFDDSCKEPFPAMTLDFKVMNAAIALKLLNLSKDQPTAFDFCSLTSQSQAACVDAYHQTQRIVESWLPEHDRDLDNLLELVISATKAVSKFETEVVQYAMVNNTPTLLRQRMIDPMDSSWTCFGWLHLLDWVQGTREVLSFEGDVATLAIVSRQYESDTLLADPLQIPTRFGLALTASMWYMCIVILFIIGYAMISGLVTRSHIPIRNIWMQQQVAGIVWIGRPLLVLRGLVAMTLLSTANLDLSTDGIFTSIEFAPRGVMQSFLASGETLWFAHAVNDILSLGTRNCSFHSSLLSSAAIWLVTFCLEMTDPFQPSATYSRTCALQYFDFQIVCDCGTVTIGSFRRLVTLCLIQLGCIVLSWLFSQFYRVDPEHSAPVAIPKVSNYLFCPTDATYRDTSSSICSGLITFTFRGKPYVFSILLWHLLPEKSPFSSIAFCRPNLRLTSTHLAQSTPSIVPVKSQRRAHFLRAVVGFLMLVSAAISSYSFLALTRSRLANDFLWEGFNSTGLQSYLIDWFNDELASRNFQTQLNMSESATMRMYSQQTSYVSLVPYYASITQFQESSLHVIVRGLRMSDPCQLMWIMTQYCYVDFNKRWSLANTQRRQQRCEDMKSNGAVYLESILRNTDTTLLHACWGESLDAGVYRYLNSFDEGQQWLRAVHSPQKSIDDEVETWNTHGITRYTVQWQNYKRIGVIEAFVIENALGSQYPITLQRQNGSYRFLTETSMKMYWSFAGDLQAIADNATAVAHKSLIRESPLYAFNNTTMTSLLQSTGVLRSPLDAALTSVQSILGPFGSVDMVHVPCPSSLLRLHRAMLNQDTTSQQRNVSAQTPVELAIQTTYPVPSRWRQKYGYGNAGNPMCPEDRVAKPLTSISNFFHIDSSCSAFFVEDIIINRQYGMMSLIAWGAFHRCKNSETCITVRDMCLNTTLSTKCVAAYTTVQTWTAQYVPFEEVKRLYSEAVSVREELAQLDLRISQYLRVEWTSQPEFATFSLFDGDDEYFEFFGWHFAFEWAKGLREVVSFQGDQRNISLISSLGYIVYQTANPLEVPSNLVYYCRLFLQYTTFVMLLVAAFTILYVVVSMGRVEGLNMLELSRVGGIVWVGRPLLFLRSLFAICLLTTASAQLEVEGYFTRIAIPHQTVMDSISTALAGSEASWLVVVLSDLGMVITKDYTNLYSICAMVIVVSTSILLSVMRPVQPTFTIDRVCSQVQVDFQLVCTAGFVKIGSVERTIVLVAIATTVLIMAYLCTRWLRPNYALPQHKTSFLLPAGAMYLFNTGPWIFDNTLYIDKASLFISGIISVPYGRRIHILDVKTWRIHVICIDDKFTSKILSNDIYTQRCIESSVPIVD